MNRLQHIFNNYDALGGIILIISAACALLLSNIESTRDLYYFFLDTPILIKVGTLEIKKNLLLWINDALMAIFFLLVGLEVKNELIKGSLANYKQAIFTVVSAIGGMIVPALIYLAFNFKNSITCSGWAIPVATDIAFALGVLALLGKRVPEELKFFLMALSIIDDLGSIIIIAIFYTNNFSILSLEIALVTILFLLICNLYNVRNIGIYMLLSIILWISFLKGGIHSTLAGVVTGFFIPLKEKNGKSPAKTLKNILNPWVVFLILPLFAFSNAGISLRDVSVSGLVSNLPIGIIVGLFIGKPLGITFFFWMALKTKLAVLPKGTTFIQIMAVSTLCGIGFTMSIFISTLTFSSNYPNFIIFTKLGVLIGSVLSAILGYTLLRLKLSAKTF